MPSIEILKKRFAFDGAIKKSLQENKDDETKVHRIEHHFIAGSSKNLTNLSGCARALGFQVSAISEGKDQGQSYWYFDVYSDRDTKLPSITREAVLMESLAMAFAAVYDGWGTLIAK